MAKATFTAILMLLGATGCAGKVEVTRTFTPTAASRVSPDQLEPVAIVRGDERIAIPRGSRVEADRVVLPPGTAPSPPGSDAVRGELEGEAVIGLRRTDGIVMHGSIAPDGDIPGGGRVESSRSTGALAAGVVVLVLSYAPTAYIGAGSPRHSDQILEVPVAGPWIDLAQRPACVEPTTPVKLPIDPCIVETASRAALITSGALQGLGALLTVVGLPSHSRIVDGGDRGVAIVPTPTGAAAIGTF